MKVLKPLGLFALFLFLLAGCKSDGDRAARDEPNHEPIADTGPLNMEHGTTGGDAAGTLNFEHRREAPKNGNFVPTTGGSATSGGDAGAKTASLEDGKEDHGSGTSAHGSGNNSGAPAAPEGH